MPMCIVRPSVRLTYCENSTNLKTKTWCDFNDSNFGSCPQPLPLITDQRRILRTGVQLS